MTRAEKDAAFLLDWMKGYDWNNKVPYRGRRLAAAILAMEPSAAWEFWVKCRLGMECPELPEE